MITKTCLIFDGSPILSGITRDLAHGSPPPALQIFSARSQWLFSKTWCVIIASSERPGTGTMLTVPRSWWVLSAFTPNSLAVDSAVVGAPGTLIPSKNELPGVGLPVVPQPLSLATSSCLLAASSTTEDGA